ncbi:MAG TPA: aminoacetone oxidase family FAD-binding enzyme, partial [Clostridiales bacterium]|nr:aminoacetone oxidase family FAD-binding enzyme [Clostridiales bacterium]
GAVVSLEFLPDISAERIEENISARLKAGYEFKRLLSGNLHNVLGAAVVSRAGSPENIVKTLKDFTLPVTGTLGFDYAQVTRGGLDMKDVTDGLESKLVKNLYFAGEILDVDGDCGGYN